MGADTTMMQAPWMDIQALRRATTPIGLCREGSDNRGRKLNQTHL